MVWICFLKIQVGDCGWEDKRSKIGHELRVGNGYIGFHILFSLILYLFEILHNEEKKKELSWTRVVVSYLKSSSFIHFTFVMHQEPSIRRGLCVRPLVTVKECKRQSADSACLWQAGTLLRARLPAPFSRLVRRCLSHDHVRHFRFGGGAPAPWGCRPSAQPHSTDPIVNKAKDEPQRAEAENSHPRPAHHKQVSCFHTVHPTPQKSGEST